MPKFDKAKQPVEILAEDNAIEIQKMIIDAFVSVLIELEYLHADDKITEKDIDGATQRAKEDGIEIKMNKNVYNGNEIVYDIKVVQIVAQIVFKGGEE